MSTHPHDIAIIGSGIIGLATGLALLERFPALHLTILEKEAEVASHQTGHNSGVIHAGIYYKPGSLKARLCVEGVRRLTAFCDRHGVAYERCGKVIVAADASELPALEELHRRGTANGVPGLRRIGPGELADLEPHARGVAALHSPNTAIVDYREVAHAMAARLRERGVKLRTGAGVASIRTDGPRLRLETAAGDIAARHVINCAGLYSDRVARMMGIRTEVQIVPFRGEYYRLRAERRSLVRGLIYPVPDPRFPFLGVHFTRTIHGEVEAGPNAVLAFAREGYARGHVRGDELWEIFAYRGFRALALRYWRTGLAESYRSLSKGAFTRALQRLVPEVRAADLAPGGAGVRAQAVAPDGRLVDDFHIVETPAAIHVLNAPSPGATASLAIGDYIAGLAARAFAL